MGLVPEVTPRWFVEWIGAMVWSQYLEILRDEHGEGLGIVGRRAGLGDLLDDFWCCHLVKEVPSIVDRVQKLETLTTQKSPDDLVCLFYCAGHEVLRDWLARGGCGADASLPRAFPTRCGA